MWTEGVQGFDTLPVDVVGWWQLPCEALITINHHEYTIDHYFFYTINHYNVRPKKDMWMLV